MIDLRQQDHDALLAARNAGAEGIPLAEVPVSSAIICALMDLALITRPPEQRFLITAQGEAHLQRLAFA